MTSADADLTAQQIAVLRLVAQGRNNQDIAEQLSVAHGTVERHVHDILFKLNVKNRTEAALWAVRHGLIDLDDKIE